MTQRIFNADPTPIGDISGEVAAPIDRAAPLSPRKQILPVPARLDQGATGTCVAMAARMVYCHAFRLKYGKWPAIGVPEVFAFYHLVRQAVNAPPDPGMGQGLTLQWALRTMKGSGYPLASGKRGPKITGYEYVGSTTDDAQRAVDQFSVPVLYRLDWDANWLYLARNRVLKAPVGHTVGGHAMSGWGYDIEVAGSSDIDANSWGKWSVDGSGMCYFPDAYKADRGLEIWRVVGIE